MRLTEEEAKDVFTSAEISELCDEGKFQSAEMIFTRDGRHYQLTINRSGSAFTKYDFELECPEVIQKVVLKKIWSLV